MAGAGPCSASPNFKAVQESYFEKKGCCGVYFIAHRAVWHRGDCTISMDGLTQLTERRCKFPELTFE